jgi:hypothetical protein
LQPARIDTSRPAAAASAHLHIELYVQRRLPLGQVVGLEKEQEALQPPLGAAAGEVAAARVQQRHHLQQRGAAAWGGAAAMQAQAGKRASCGS